MGKPKRPRGPLPRRGKLNLDLPRELLAQAAGDETPGDGLPSDEAILAGMAFVKHEQLERRLAIEEKRRMVLESLLYRFTPATPADFEAMLGALNVVPEPPPVAEDPGDASP